MRFQTSLALCLWVVAAAGCTESQRGPADDQATNALMISSYNDAAIDNAILAQHTIFAYHFVNDGAALNELGQHDLGVLAAHYKECPGTLNVRRGDTPAALYEARVAKVRRALVEVGVKEENITLAQGFPGGDGMTTERVLRILGREKKDASQGSSSTTMPLGASGGMGGASGLSGGSYGQGMTGSK